MDFKRQWRRNVHITLTFLVFSAVSSHELLYGTSLNVSTVGQVTEGDTGQRHSSSWYSVSGNAVPRWNSQMAFSKTVYSFTVKENTLPGTVVGKVDVLLESPTPITYSVQEDDGENLFLLSPLSGEFLLSRTLDFETQRFFILSVGAQQGESQVSSVRVYFNVLDVNDNRPIFSQETFSTSVLENTQAGTCFMALNVSDKDDGDNGKLNLRVVNGDEYKTFFINPSGSLCLQSELDQERRSTYNLTVTANDYAQPPYLQFTSTAYVTITVEDVNDNAPQFVSGSSVYVPEDTALNATVMTAHAEDADAGSNGEVLYYLTNSPGGVFSINNESGRIYLQGTLDREHTDRFTVTLTAVDRGSPPLSSTMNVTVTVEDANDHDPVFTQSTYNLNVKEDISAGISIFKVQAHDQDIRSNGQVRYSLADVGPFVVDSVRGDITVMSKLDRETDSNYLLILTAVDQGNPPRSATATVSIIVLDVNDCAPLFSPEIVTIHVMENEVDSTKLTYEITAVDEDLGFNSELTYFIEKGNNDLFSISPTGTFQIQPSLDRERESLYSLIITAVDSGIPALTGSLTVFVVVDDVNDNHPEFTEEAFNTIVSEDSLAGTVFAMITASDIDDGDNGEIRYLMVNDDVPFSIEEASGELFTTDILDRETVAEYRLTVIATDKHPTEPLSSSVLVTVLIGDINDHWPQFLNSPYVAYVPTEIEPGTVVCAVSAADEDTEMSAELRYSLYGQASDVFSIDAYSGTVFILAALRRAEDIILNVHVEDSGENPKFDITTISIRFQNVSEFPEMRVDTLGSSLSEDEPVGTIVAQVTATSSRAEPISFYLASGNFEEMFHMDQLSGILMVEKSLDYEMKKEFTLLIEARDSGSPPFSSFEEIHINITDVNDNFPLFTQVEYRCEVFENSPPSLVCDVLAIDADSGTYGTVQYNITEGNPDYFFMIDPENGLLSTTVTLDREYIPEFNMTIEAVELDDLQHRDRATVIVTVLDRNDNAPRFSQVFITEVREDSPIGHTILHVTSTDDDTDSNSEITYSIIDKSDDLPFDIDFITGYITVCNSLDREVQDHYIVKVNANDSAWSISTDVSILITDVNDNRPIFSESFYRATMPETLDSEVFVTKVHATDADIGQNNEILYVIEPPNEEFWVNVTSGEIYTKQPLILHNTDFDIYQFGVTAYDCGSAPLYSDIIVTVRVEPRNHYPPLFLPLPPLIAIPYDMLEGTEVVNFKAIDQDVNNSSANIDYFLNGGNGHDFFMIQADSGKLTLMHNLLQHLNSLLFLSVIAKDRGLPSLSSQTQITFEITGKNTFSPSFREQHVTFSVPEDLPEGSVIGKVQAEDEDIGSNGDIMYYIETEPFAFSVGEVSGLLTLIRKLDFEKEGIYELQVKAKDGGWASRTGVLNVTVVVQDVNDNPPLFAVSEFITSVPENSEIGTNVLNVVATDDDSGTCGQITFSLTAGHVDKFVIDSRNGTITTLDIFDYEQHQAFDLTIKAANFGGHPLFSLAHVVIRILDVNEFKPTFKEKEFYFSVSKSVPTGTRIGKVEATDYDLGPEGQVFYLMFGPNKYLGLEINHTTGEIYTTGSLRKQGNSNLVLNVLAKNTGIITGTDVDEALVLISVIDTNDAPMFTSTQYFVNVTEDSLVGTYVTTVTALDQDSILNWNRFFYSIQDGNTNFSFAVNPSSGVISVNSQLDREQWPMYNLILTATDNGSPPATGTTNVIVTIGDVNDNGPLLTSTEAQVKENLPQGIVVAKLNAIDPDLPPNQGPFTYWLVNTSRDSAVSLTPDGVLFTTRAFDREQTFVYKVVVALRDAGIPPMTSTTVFHIWVEDENDNPPTPRNIFIEVKYFGSSFQGGMIGNVHPEDLDVSDTFTCAIRSGPLSMFSIANGTCELWSAPFQGEATYNITIEASDQLHYPVNNSVYVNYKGFTNASVDNCILFYVSSSSMEEFLTNKYLRFVKALDSLFNLHASKTHVFGIKQIGFHVLLLAAVKNYNGQYLSREVASAVSAGHKKLLESQSNATFSHITSDPCLTSPCRNGATCNKNLFISQDVVVLQSPAVIFVSPQKEIFNCTCPGGFSGILCEDDIDECEDSPCDNGGTCVNTPGGFHCHCPTGFSGIVCSTDVEKCLKMNCQNNGTCVHNLDGYQCQCVPGFEGVACEQNIDHCRSTPCVQGSCINSLTGFTCLCPFGVSGVHCEEQSYGFGELSYLEFPPLDHRTNLISLEFATVQRNALLVYNPGEASTPDFLAVEILDGAVQLTYDLGSGLVRLQTNKQVADGEFHLLNVRRIGSMGSLNVDSCTDIENDGFCFSQTFGILERTLDVGNVNMTFGALKTVEPVLLHPGQIQTHNFVGCIRQINVNGVQLRPSMAIAVYNILESCPRPKSSPCKGNPCQNNGVCHDNWSDYVCECRSHFTGKNCNQEMSEELVLRFSGNEIIEFVIKERFRRDYLLNQMVKSKEGNAEGFNGISIKFKTNGNGVLFYVLEQKGFSMLQIKDRKLWYTSQENVFGDYSDVSVDLPVSDGLWHVVSLLTDTQNTVLLVDDKAAFNTTHSLDLTPLHVEKIVLGGVDNKVQQTGFIGCVQYFNVTGYTLALSGHSETVEVRPSPTLLQNTCSVCLPAACSNEGPLRTKCGSAQIGACVCLHNVSQEICDLCVSASSNPSQCIESEANAKLWLLALILPLLSALAFIVLFVVLFIRRERCQTDSLPQKTEPRAAVFCFDENRTITSTACEKSKPLSMISDLAFYSNVSISHLQASNDEPENSSICSVFNSDTASIKLTWPRHFYSKRSMKAGAKQWGDLKMLLAGFEKEYCCQESLSKTQNVSQNKQQVHINFPQDAKSPYTTTFIQTGFVEPVQSLTFEEIDKLNSSLDQKDQTDLRTGLSSPTMDISTESETDSTFTCSEYGECENSITQLGTNLTSFKQTSYSEGCPSAKCTHTNALDHLECILTLLPFSSYAPVFEDIASLPLETSPNAEMQSDFEEII